MRRPIKRIASLVAAGAFAAVILSTIAPAHADNVGGIREFGWWTKRPGAQPTPNGFEIANGPDGAESVAAFRVVLTGSVTQATITFTESTDSNVAKVSGTPAIKVCTTTTTWTAEQQGTFDKAPKPDCATAVKMTVDAKATWTADVTALLTGKSGDVSLMAVPDTPATAGLVGGTFNRQFGAPRVDTDGTPGPSSTGAGSSTYTPPTVPHQEFAAGQVFPTPPPAPVPLNPNGTISAAPSSPTPTTQANVVSPQGVTIGVAHAAAHKEWGRLLLYVPLAGILGLVYVRARKALLDRGLVPAS